MSRLSYPQQLVLKFDNGGVAEHAQVFDLFDVLESRHGTRVALPKGMRSHAKKEHAFSGLKRVFFLVICTGILVAFQKNAVQDDNHEIRANTVVPSSLAAVVPHPVLNKPTSVLKNQSSRISPEQVLSDPLNRVSPAFQVDESLRNRVKFWFDIYTRHDSKTYVIHHVDFPWIIFDVVDIKPLLSGPGNYWTKYFRAQKVLNARLASIKSSVKKVSSKHSKKKLTPFDLKISAILRSVPGPQKPLPKDLDDVVRVQMGQRNFMLDAINKATPFLPFMEGEFVARGVPVELARIPLVESSFNTIATSKVGAAGVWQLMPNIGRQFLLMDRPFDERRSPLKSTAVAAVMLKENFRMLRSWPLGVTAYNHGPGGLLKASKLLKTTNLSRIISLYRGNAFGFATSNFYAEFLAALFSERYKEVLFKNELSEDSFFELAQVQLRHRQRLDDLAKTFSVSRDVILKMNPDLSLSKVPAKKIILPAGYRLFVPRSIVAQLMTKENGG